MHNVTPPCGCKLDVDPGTGALFSVSKCAAHAAAQRETRELGEDYYRELGSIDANGQPVTANYVAEFLDGFGEPVSPRPGKSRLAVEIGGGATPYVSLLRQAGWVYHGFESSQWAVNWANRQYGPGSATQFTFTKDTGLTLPADAGMVLCAHALEHFHKPFAVLACIHQMLEPGGVFYCLIPDGRHDLVNPDHIFFFCPQSIRRSMESAGFVVDSINSRRRTEHEDFLYITARAVK